MLQTCFLYTHRQNQSLLVVENIHLGLLQQRCLLIGFLRTHIFLEKFFYSLDHTKFIKKYELDCFVFKEVGEIVISNKSCCWVKPLHNEYKSVLSHQLQYIINYRAKKIESRVFLSIPGSYLLPFQSYFVQMLSSWFFMLLLLLFLLKFLNHFTRRTSSPWKEFYLLFIFLVFHLFIPIFFFIFIFLFFFVSSVEFEHRYTRRWWILWIISIFTMIFVSFHNRDY